MVLSGLFGQELKSHVKHDVMSELERVVNAAVSGHFMWRVRKREEEEGGKDKTEGTREERCRTGLVEHH